MRPLSKAPIPQLLPGRRNMAAHCSGCVFTAVSVHLDGLNAEDKFRVWVTILGHTPLPFPLSLYKVKIIAQREKTDMETIFTEMASKQLQKRQVAQWIKHEKIKQHFPVKHTPICFIYNFEIFLPCIYFIFLLNWTI